jgi:hypothetical protein
MLKFLLNEGALAGDAFPLAVQLDPSVGEARAPRVWLSFGGAGFTIHAGDDSCIAVNVHLHALVVHVLRARAGGGNRTQVFGPVHE